MLYSYSIIMLKNETFTYDFVSDIAIFITSKKYTSKWCKLIFFLKFKLFSNLNLESFGKLNINEFMIVSFLSHKLYIQNRNGLNCATNILIFVSSLDTTHTIRYGIHQIIQCLDVLCNWDQNKYYLYYYRFCDVSTIWSYLCPIQCVVRGELKL